MVKSGQAWAGTFVTLDATGALEAGTPSGVLYVDGVADAATVTITGSNPYKFSVTLPTLTAGQRVDMYITATISTIATAGIVASEQADTTLLSDGVTLADDAITSAKFDESTAFPVKSQDSGATALARTGADSDTLETLSDQIDTIDSSGVADAVWSNADRTLTQTATSIASSISGSTITDVRGDTWSIDITDLTLDSNKQQFAIKRHAGDADSAALLFVDSDDGLLYINGAAGTASDASLVYAGTTLTLTVKPAATAQIPSGTHKYGIQSVTAAGVVNEAYGGTFTVQADVVKATA